MDLNHINLVVQHVFTQNLGFNAGHVTSLINQILYNFSLNYKTSLKIEFNDPFCPFTEKFIFFLRFVLNFTSEKSNNAPT